MSRITFSALRANTRTISFNLSKPICYSSLAIRIASERRKAVFDSQCPSSSSANVRFYATDSAPVQKKPPKKPTSPRTSRGNAGSPQNPSKKATAKQSTRKRARKIARKPEKKLIDPLTEKVQKVRELRQQALVKEAPKSLPVTAFMVYSTQNATGTGKGTIGERMKEISADFKGLSSSELAIYDNTARQNREANKKAMRDWILNYSPDVIRKANNARLSLNRLAKEPVPTGRKKALVARQCKKLEDPRQIKRVDTPYIAFAKQLWASGDLDGVKPIEAMKKISNEYRNLSVSELQTLRDRYKQDRAKYLEEFNRLYTSNVARKTKKASS